jgi:hypothetical protein
VSETIDKPVSTADYLIRKAVEANDATLTSVLLDWYREEKQQTAYRAFLQARSKFQSKVPVLAKTKKAHNYQYAPMGDIVEQIRKLMHECGLTFSFVISDDDANTIRVTCLLSHIEGHKEGTSMSSGAETSGSKNAIQARASAITYMQRYTLLGALGITTADEDMDGRIPSELITPEQVESIKKRLEQTNSDTGKFLKAVGVTSFDEIPANKYGTVDALLTKKETPKP